MSLAYLRRHAQPCPRRCKLAIVWTVTENGRRQAVNLAEEPMATTAVRVDGAGTIRSRVVSDDFPLMPLETLHLPHAAVCKPAPGETPPTRREYLTRLPPAPLSRPHPRTDGLADVIPIWKKRAERSGQ